MMTFKHLSAVAVVAVATLLLLASWGSSVFPLLLFITVAFIWGAIYTAYAPPERNYSAAEYARRQRLAEARAKHSKVRLVVDGLWGLDEEDII